MGRRASGAKAAPLGGVDDALARPGSDAGALSLAFFTTASVRDSEIKENLASRDAGGVAVTGFAQLSARNVAFGLPFYKGAVCCDAVHPRKHVFLPYMHTLTSITQNTSGVFSCPNSAVTATSRLSGSL